MLRRLGILGLLALWAGASGCTTATRRADGTLAFRPGGWTGAEAPPQTRVSLPPERADVLASEAPAEGLSKYFPGLRRTPADASRAATARPSWFAFARRNKGTQLYTTDARSGIGRGMAEASALPVALQIPSEKATDGAVTPTTAEGVVPGGAAPTPDAASPAPSAPSPAGPGAPDLGDLLGTPREEAGSPTASAQPPASVAVGRMPQVPAIDPRERPRLTSPEPASAQPKAPTTDPSIPDEKTSKAIAPPSEAMATPEPTVRTSFLHRIASSVWAGSQAPMPVVLASPQSPPPPPKKVRPTPQALPTPQARPTPQVRPTSQVAPSPQSPVCEHCGAKIAKPNCIKRKLQMLLGGEPAAH